MARQQGASPMAQSASNGPPLAAAATLSASALRGVAPDAARRSNRLLGRPVQRPTSGSGSDARGGGGSVSASATAHDDDSDAIERTLALLDVDPDAEAARAYVPLRPALQGLTAAAEAAEEAALATAEAERARDAERRTSAEEARRHA